MPCKKDRSFWQQWQKPKNCKPDVSQMFSTLGRLLLALRLLLSSVFLNSMHPVYSHKIKTLYAQRRNWQIGLDRYHAGDRYPILLETAIPIPMPMPIPEMTSPIALGIHTLSTLCTPSVSTFQNIMSVCFEKYIQYAYAVSSWWHYQKKNS